MEDIKTLNIYEKLSLITEEIGVIEKGLKVQVNKTSSYKAVSERDVLDAVKPIEKKYRVYSYPVKREVIDRDTLVKESEYNGTITRTNTLFMRIETTYRFVNIDKTDEYIETTVYGDGLDTGDKAPGKAMTYADKYALMKAYKLSTGDDPDKETSPERGYEKKGNGKSPYDFEKNPMTEEQAYIIASLTPEQKETLRNFYKKDIMNLTYLEAEKSINSLKAKGLIKTKEEKELERKEKEEVF